MTRTREENAADLEYQERNPSYPVFEQINEDIAHCHLYGLPLSEIILDREEWEEFIEASAEHKLAFAGDRVIYRNVLVRVED